jgi:hypothetical protein
MTVTIVIYRINFNKMQKMDRSKNLCLLDQVFFLESNTLDSLTKLASPVADSSYRQLHLRLLSSWSSGTTCDSLRRFRRLERKIYDLTITRDLDLDTLFN